ncbi:MAG: glycosyltransferase family 4 protein [Bacillota bacterium]
MMKIIVATSLLSPYRVDWLDELGKVAEVDVFYLIDKDNSRNSDWISKRPKHCNYTIMQGINFYKIGKISFDFIKYLKKNKNKYDVIIVDGYGFATQILNLMYLNKKKYKYYVNVDGLIASRNEKKIIAWIKTMIISRFPYCLSGSKATNQILVRYGMEEENIFNHPFTSLFNHDILQEVVSNEKKIQLRDELEIKEEKVVISVGRFSYLNGYGKGYDALLRAAKIMDSNIGWYIIGGKPTKEFEELTIKYGLLNVHYIDHIGKEQLNKYYLAADIFVLMTIGDVWGLVINEAMAQGLPIITTDKCVAGLELVENGENGYIIPVGDVVELSNTVSILFDDEALLEKMSKNSIKKIKMYTIENMASRHMEIFVNNGMVDK